MDPLHDISKPINLNYFASEQWVRTLGFLRKHFNLSDDDCKDVFQESFIILYDQICAGKLEELTSSLSTYFLAICRNKALQHLSKSKRKAADSDTLLALSDGEILPDKVDALLALDTDDVAVVEQKEELVRDIVQDLPYPCNELLWGFYRDNLSMRALAAMLSYSSESVAKVTKHRCCEKFRARYNQLCNKLF